ncbi:MAG: WD40/YVTN/BNR-like repeat-containing protein [Woeseiaceae bacterium]
MRITAVLISGLLAVKALSAVAQVAPEWQSLLQVEDVEYFRGMDVSDNGRTVWVTGAKGTVMRSTDGGDTWTRLAVPGDLDDIDIGLRDIEAFNRDEAFAISSGGGEASRIYFTADGGATWIEQHRNTYPSGFYNAMAWWDRQNGIVFSDPVDGYILVLRTSDGGETWQELGGPRGMPSSGENNLRANENEQGFAASGTCAEAAPGGFAWILTSDGNESRVHMTNDYGVTWTLSNPSIIVNNATSGPFASALLDDKIGIVVGGDHQDRQGAYENMALTRDGGRSWIRPDNFPVGHRSSVHYLDDQLLVTIGSHGTDFSTDGGMSWTKISEEGFYTAVANGHTVWAAGSDGRIARLRLGGFR